MPHTITRCDIELELQERRPDLGDRDAIALLRSDFQLALNASHFIALSADDPHVSVASRTPLGDGHARYDLTLQFVPRPDARGEQAAAALVRSEFARAFNASQFLHVAVSDPVVRVVPSQRSERVAPPLRRAA